MSNKIGIITFQAALNYGALLQAYSLKQFLNSCGCQAEVVNYVPPFLKHQSDPKFSLYKNPKNIIKMNLQVLSEKKNFVAFQAFRKKQLELSDVITDNELENILNKYDIVIYGSDQVWNSNITRNNLYYFGKSVKKGTKKISYAASMGNKVGNLSDEEIKLIKNLNAVSVREKEAENYLKTLGIDSKCVGDPVFLNTSEFWKKEIDNVKLAIKEKYIFYYTIEHNQKLAEEARSYAVKHGLKLISAHGRGTKQNEYAEYLNNIGPLEFVALIKNAEVVFTNSFHATAFSSIFEKNTYISLHSNTGSRIINLLNIMGKDYNNNNKCEFIDFSEIDRKLLESQIVESQKYLVNNI